MLESDDLGHESAQPLGVQEIELAEFGLQVIVVQEHSTLVQEDNSLLHL